MAILIILAVIIMILSCCKAAGDADELAENVYRNCEEVNC